MKPSRQKMGKLNRHHLLIPKYALLFQYHDINYLWNKYSNGHFGFNVQKQIWQNMGGNKEPDSEAWSSFASEVGWLRSKMGRQKLLFFIDSFEEIPTVWFDNLIFSIKAPKGHLPCFSITGMTLVVSLILLRCEECGL
ncbi:MAG: GUN4 domain-containing protein [Nostoc sp.]|uniref:GUN4 domain-containing protein n=1 Tax=unclassified Nostoc TaxID=2593658 RepID=UPI002600D13D|nr:GUN4 domain-containing protein [Nostoc sp. NOS(2021)]